MSARPVWEGHLKLSLVSCPVALYNATSRAGDVSFHMINPKTGNRVKMATVDPDVGEVDRKDLVKGYEIEKGKYVTLTDDEIKSVRLESTRTIEIERFVDVAEIDRLWWNDPYFLVPDGKAGIDAFIVIREAMTEARRVAIGRLTLHTRERMVAIEPRGAGLVVTTLRSHDELHDPETLFNDIPARKPDRKMVEIAEKIIEQQHAAFDPAEFTDRYEDALKALIASKGSGDDGGTKMSAPKASNVVSLMDALRRSLGTRGSDRAVAQKRAAKTAPSPAKVKPRKRAAKR